MTTEVREITRRLNQLKAAERTRFLTAAEDQELDSLIQTLNEITNERTLGYGVCADLNDPDY